MKGFGSQVLPLASLPLLSEEDTVPSVTKADPCPTHRLICIASIIQARTSHTGAYGSERAADVFSFE